jgi:iron complex transport system ATP-binding protein
VPFTRRLLSNHAARAIANGAPPHLLCLVGGIGEDGRRMKSTNPILEVSDLHVRRGHTIILQRVSWRVERGQHWVILGANGSGKTSLLSALTGYLTPSGGEITVLGRRYGETDWRELRTQIGLVSSSIRQLMPNSEPALESVVSGKYAMVDFWGEITRTDRSRAARILKQIECFPLAERPWLFLSQGERQRVLIGRALMARPRILVLDEPCAGLDPVAREHFLQFLDRLGRRRKAPTLILVTHHVEEIMPVFSHTLLLKAGRVLAAGKQPEVLCSRLLSKSFGASLRLRAAKGRYALEVTPVSGAVV